MRKPVEWKREFEQLQQERAPISVVTLTPPCVPSRLWEMVSQRERGKVQRVVIMIEGLDGGNDRA